MEKSPENARRFGRVWRRERDSNPRDPCGSTRVPGERTRPLCDLSVYNEISVKQCNEITYRVGFRESLQNYLLFKDERKHFAHIFTFIELPDFSSNILFVIKFGIKRLFVRRFE